MTRATHWTTVAVPAAAAMVLRQPLESSMALHMLVQLPLLVLAGVQLGRPADGARSRTADAWDPHGIAGLLLATCLVSAWMIPRALDAAVAELRVDAVKALVLVAAGAMGADAWTRAPLAVRLFMGGNLGWMLASMGVLLASTPVRLCAQYALRDQLAAGYGLVALVAALAAVACWPLMRPRATYQLPRAP